MTLTIAGYALALLFFLLWLWERGRREAAEGQIAELEARIQTIREAME